MPGDDVAADMAGLTRRALLAAAAALAGCGETMPAMSWPQLGARDPAGNALTLPSASARPRVINMWALWCAPCRRELPGLQRLGEALARQGIDVLGIALARDLFAVREYLAQQGLALPTAIVPPDAPSVRPLQLASLPQTFVVSRAGGVLARWRGAREWDAPDVRRELRRVLDAA